MMSLPKEAGFSAPICTYRHSALVPLLHTSSGSNGASKPPAISLYTTKCALNSSIPTAPQPRRALAVVACTNPHTTAPHSSAVSNFCVSKNTWIPSHALVVPTRALRCQAQHKCPLSRPWSFTARTRHYHHLCMEGDAGTDFFHVKG